MDSRRLNVAWLGPVAYAAALELQNGLVAARLQETVGDLLLLLEHPHVFTLGRGADERYLLESRPDIPVYRVSRGGQVTYHGPGQLVAYPIIKLAGTDRDVIRYLRRLEQSLIDALATIGIGAGRREGFTGVWVGGRKIASIGVGLRRWVTLHGMALNVTNDLSLFDAIVPCGIEGCRMTSITAEGHSEVAPMAFAERLTESFAAVFDYPEYEWRPASDIWRLAASSATSIAAGGELVK